MKLEKWEKNAIFKAMQEGGLHPSEFKFADGEDDVRIDHRLSASYFLIGGDALRYVGSYVVGDAAPWPYEDSAWPRLMARISRWVKNVKSDVETPDLWAELQRETELFGAGPDEAVENTSFTPDEREVIEAQFRVLREKAQSAYSLSDAQMLILDAKIDYLIGADDRLGRIDWRNVVVGTMFAYALEAALPPGSARDILLTLLRSTAHFYAQGFQALPGP